MSFHILCFDILPNRIEIVMMCKIACASSAFRNRTMNRHICIVIIIEYVVVAAIYSIFLLLINDVRAQRISAYFSITLRSRKYCGFFNCRLCACVDCLWVESAKTNIVIGWVLFNVCLCLAFKNWLCPILFCPSAIHEMLNTSTIRPN